MKGDPSCSWCKVKPSPCTASVSKVASLWWGSAKGIVPLSQWKTVAGTAWHSLAVHFSGNFPRFVQIKLNQYKMQEVLLASPFYTIVGIFFSSSCAMYCMVYQSIAS